MKLPLYIALIAMLLGMGAAIADDSPPRTISVTGSGTVQAAPDMAMITIGVSSVAPTARAALDENNARTTKVFAFLASSGVADKDMQSTNLSVSPQYRNYRPQENRKPEIIGYMVNNNVRVAVRDLSSFGKILDGVVTAGANNINGIRFDISKRQTLTRDAMANAVKDGIAQAKNIASAAGLELGPVLSIGQSGGIRPPQQFMARSMAAEAVPIAAGELTISASATMVFAIE